MATPDLTPRARRLEEEDVSALSDTVLDIKHTVDHHTRELAAIRSTQAQHGEALVEILRRLDPA